MVMGDEDVYQVTPSGEIWKFAGGVTVTAPPVRAIPEIVTTMGADVVPDVTPPKASDDGVEVSVGGNGVILI